MSEFKFACPVCGQHITADSNTSGGQVECPTCFRKMIVPQAPASADSKLILSAVQVGTPRPIPGDLSGSNRLKNPSRWKSLVPTITFILASCAAAIALFSFRDRIFVSRSRAQQETTNPPAINHPRPTKSFWTLDLSKAVVPETTAVGRIRGNGFFCDKAILQGGTLQLRQGQGKPPEVSVAIILFARQEEDLAGKSFEIRPDRAPPLPRIVLRWKDDQQQSVVHTIHGGYALKMVFAQPADGHIAGKLYLSLPDEAKSFVAGKFDAEIRKPNPPRPHPPKPPSSTPQ